MNDWLVGSAEIAQMLGVSRQRVSQLTSDSEFPVPAAELIGGRVWLRTAVLDWIAARPERLTATLNEGTAMFEKFSEGSRRMVISATEAAKQQHASSISALHLLRALTEEATTAPALESIGVIPEVVSEALPPNGQVTADAASLPFTEDMKKALALAGLIARHEEVAEVTPAHMLAALANPDQAATFGLLTSTSGLPVRQLDSRLHELTGLKGMACSFCQTRFPRLSVVWAGTAEDPRAVICGNCSSVIGQSFTDWQ